MFKLFKRNKKEENKRIEKEGFVVWKYINNLECGIEEVVVGIFEEEEAAWEMVKELEEEEKEFGNNDTIFDYEFEKWTEK